MVGWRDIGVHLTAIKIKRKLKIKITRVDFLWGLDKGLSRE
jgi:hypothetical protein